MIRLLTQAGSCRMAAAALTAAIFWGASAPVQARIDRFEILKTEPAFEGRSFDSAGEFERIIARAHGSLDPSIAPEVSMNHPFTPSSIAISCVRRS